MELDGADADVELLSDFRIREALTEKVEHFSFTVSQIKRRRRGRMRRQHTLTLRWELRHRVTWFEKKRKGPGDRFLLRQGFA